MESKIYFLCVIFLLIVQQSTAKDSYSRKGSNSVSDSKTNYNNDDDDSIVDLNKYDRSKDYQPQASTYRRNQYSPSDSSSNNYRSQSRLSSSYDDKPDSSSNNYRSQSRWPSSYDDKSDSYDRSQYGYGSNNRLSGYPGPLPPAAFDSGAYLGNGPSCYSLLDPQYPLFSDICGAVPQARYSLPNSFGHLERWQIAQVLTAILGPLAPISPNPTCSRSLRLLLCPLLFPPCPTRYEAPPVLPCQPFCRVVKNQCASPSLDLLPCDLLPPSSDLCPINPAPYSSLLSSFGQPSPLNGGLLPGGFSQSSLQALLAQSALQSGFPQFDISPQSLSSLFSPPPLPPMFSQSPYSSGLSPFDVSPSPFSQSPFSSGLSPFDASPSPFSQSPYSQSPFSSGPSSYSSGPSPYSSGPSSYSSGPSPYSSGPSSYASGPSPYSSGPSSYASGPSPYSSGPSSYSSGPSPFSQSPFSSGLSPFDISPSPFSQSPFSSGFSPFDVSPSPFSSSPYSSGPSSYLSALSPSEISPSTLSSLFSSSPYSSGLTPPGVPSPSRSSFRSSFGGPPSAMSSLLSPLNGLFNSDSFNTADSLTPILVDFPPLQYAQNYRSGSRYYPQTRSATEKV